MRPIEIHAFTLIDHRGDITGESDYRAEFHADSSEGPIGFSIMYDALSGCAYVCDACTHEGDLIDDDFLSFTDAQWDAAVAAAASFALTA